MSKEIAVRYFESLKTHDAAKVAETFHPDISSWDALAGAAQGKANVTAGFTQLFQMMPDVAFEPVKYVIEGNRGAVEWIWTATLPNGKLRIPGMDLMEFQDGLIRSIKFYYDPTPLKG